ncbi:MAG: hypothetical protein ACI8UO_004913 [Verrucomicrobiales bacterium]|jgi:hypothetical protein
MKHKIFWSLGLAFLAGGTHAAGDDQPEIKNPVTFLEAQINGMRSQARGPSPFALFDPIHNGPASEPGGPLFADNSESDASDADALEGDGAQLPNLLELNFPGRRDRLRRDRRRSLSPGQAALVQNAGAALTIAEEESPWSFSVDGGYQSRYYYLGLNQIESAVASFNSDETQMWYGGVTAAYKGFSAGVRYVQSANKLQALRAFPDVVTTNYEEWVFDVKYSLDILPQQLLNVTGGYEAIYFPEYTFWETDRQDHIYVSVGSSPSPYFRPSVAYHVLSEDDGEFDPVLEGEVLVFQVDGTLALSDRGLPFDLVYYAQAGLDDEYNVSDGNGLDHDWWQAGVSLPINIGGFVITPNWHYNERVGDGNEGQTGKHFWGVNTRFDF